MKQNVENNPVGVRLRHAGATGAAFTLIELLVIVVVIAILFVMLVPGMCRAKSQSKLSQCQGNFRQWVLSANLYAADNQQRLPTFPNLNFGENIWNTGTAFPTNMAAYGVNVPRMWFCPFRPSEINSAVIVIGRPVVTMNDLMQFLYSRYGIGGESLLFDAWWVPRQGQAGTGPGGSATARDMFPMRINGYTNTSASGFDWPMKTSDKTSATVPIITDTCFSGALGGIPSKNVQDIDPRSAHFVNGKLDSINAGYADGRVEVRRPSVIAPRWAAGVGGAGNGPIWFY